MAEDSEPVVKLSGVIGVHNIAAAHEELLAAAAADFGLDLSGVTELDITLIQLVEAARASARQSGRRFRLAEAARGQVLETLERAGFLTAPAPERRAFWLGGAP